MSATTMYLSPRQWRVILSALILAAACIYFYLPARSASRHNVWRTITDLEGLQEKIEGLEQELLAYDLKFTAVDAGATNTLEGDV